MQIQLISNANVNSVPTAKGSYQVAEIAYKRDGKVEGRKVMSFVNKSVFDIISKAKEGDIFDVTTEKDNKGYWQWTAIVASGAGETGTSGATSPSVAKTVRPTYESAEERAAKQIYIVRQSSIANAIQYHTLLKGKDNGVENVLATAKQFEDFVFAKEEKGAFEDMTDDIPF